MNAIDPPPITIATITGPCWASRHGRYGFAALPDGRRIELSGLADTHRSGMRLEVRQDARGCWAPAASAGETGR